jgi:purine-binding chemotaxis protein CheW
MRYKREKIPAEETFQPGLFQRRQAAVDHVVREFAVFSAGDSFFGIDIMSVREIIKPGPVTCAPLAPSYVLGVFNLRGQIITVIDLAAKLSLKASDDQKRSRYIVVEFEGEKIGLLIDSVLDVIEAKARMIEKAPASLQMEQGNFFSGVIRMKDRLIGILNLEKLLGTN